MRTEHLYEFTILAKHSNFFKAAEELYISQTSLSRHIKSLEEEVGNSLVHRTTKRVELTDVGKSFLEYAQKSVAIEKEYLLEANKKLKELNGVLVVGYNENMPVYQMTKVMSEFMKEYPNINISVMQDGSAVLEKAIMDDMCDVAFVQKKPDSPVSKLLTTTLFLDSLVAVLPQNHPLANKDPLSLSDLRDERFVLMETQTVAMIPYCNDAGFEPQLVYPGSRGRVIYDLISNGLCITLNWKRVAQSSSDPRVVIKELVPPVYTCINVVCKRSDKLSAAKNLLYRFVIERSHFDDVDDTAIPNQEATNEY